MRRTAYGYTHIIPVNHGLLRIAERAAQDNAAAPVDSVAKEGVSGMLFGLIVAGSWGISHFLLTLIARRSGMVQTGFAMRLLVAPFLVAGLLLWSEMPDASSSVWAIALGIALLDLIGSLLLYRSFTIGSLALVAPLSSGFAVVTLALALFISGERPAAVAIGGALLVIAGVICVACGPHRGTATTLAGVPEALGSVVCLGVAFWLADVITPVLGPFWPALVMCLVGVAGFWTLLCFQGIQPVTLVKLPWGRIGVVAGLSSMGLVTLHWGVSVADTAIVTPLASLSSTVTTVLAGIFLRERLALWQWAGGAVILLGVVLVSSG